MANNGFAPENLERRGFGFDRPLASNDTPEGVPAIAGLP